jgi:hypothetical protein
MQFSLFAMVEIMPQPRHEVVTGKACQSYDDICAQKIRETNDLSVLLELKVAAEKNAYVNSNAIVDAKLIEFYNPNILCYYISLFCNNPKDPKTLDFMKYISNSRKIIIALHMLRDSFLNEQNLKLRQAAIQYYNYICQVITSWNVRNQV